MRQTLRLGRIGDIAIGVHWSVVVIMPASPYRPTSTDNRTLRQAEQSGHDGE